MGLGFRVHGSFVATTIGLLITYLEDLGAL